MENYGIEHFDEGAQEATLWVGPDGTDNAAGTFENPLASIQTAIDRLDGEFGIDTLKQVRIKPGTYQENLVLNSANWRFIGESFNTLTSFATRPSIVIEPDDSSRPVLTVTNITRDAVDQFEEDGGVSYSFTAPNTYSYTGADLDGREFRREQEGPIPFDVEFVRTDIENRDSDVPTIALYAAPYNGNATAIKNVSFRDGVIMSTNKTAFFAKNAGILMMQATDLFSGSRMVFDRCGSFHLGGYGAKNIPRGTRPQVSNTFIINGDSSVSSTEGGFGNETSMNGVRTHRSAGAFYAFGEIRRGIDTFSGSNVEQEQPISSGQGKDLFLEPSIDIGKVGRRFRIKSGNYDARGSGTQYVSDLRCQTGIYQGTGTLDVQHLEQWDSGGTFDIIGGSGHVIRGGHVSGNLNISGGTDVELRGVTIDGDLIVDGDNTSVTLKGCHVEGTLDLDSGNDSCTATVSGGTIMNTTDPGSGITTESVAIG